MCGKSRSASVVHHEGDGGRLFHSITLSVTTRCSSQIHPSLSAQRAANPSGRAGRYHVQSRLASRVGRRVLQRDRRDEWGDSARKTSPSRFRLRRRASATVARGRGRQGLVHEAPGTKRFGRLEGAVAATTQTSPRNCPGSCSQRVPGTGRWGWRGPERRFRRLGVHAAYTLHAMAGPTVGKRVGAS